MDINQLLDFESQQTVNGCPELWGIKPLITDFFSGTSSQRGQAAIGLAEHESPVAKYFGGAALIEYAVKSRRITGNLAHQYLDYGSHFLNTAYDQLLEDDRFPDILIRTALELGDVAIRRALHVENRKPAVEELNLQHANNVSFLMYAADLIETLDPRSHDYGDLVGTGAELAVSTLLTRFITRKIPDGEYVLVGSLLSEDYNPKQAEFKTKEKHNWDVSIFTGEKKFNPFRPTYKLQVKNYFNNTPYAKGIPVIILEEILTGLRTGKIAFVQITQLVRGELEGNPDCSILLDVITDTLLDKMDEE